MPNIVLPDPQIFRPAVGPKLWSRYSPRHFDEGCKVARAPTTPLCLVQNSVRK